MAVNKKGGPVNSLFDDDEFGLAELGRLAEQNEREPAAFRELRLRARRARQTINSIEDMEASEPGSTSLPLFQKLKSQAVNAKSNLEPRMALYKVAQRERLNAQAVNTIGREYSESSVNSYVNEAVNSQEAQAAGLNIASRTGYSDLSSRRTAIVGEMGGIRQTAMGAAGEFIQGRGVNPNAAGVISDSQSKFRELAKELTEVTAGMQHLKRQGLDPQGRMKSLTGGEQNAFDVLHMNRLQSDVASGSGLGGLSAKDLKIKEAEAAQKLIKAMDDLRNSMGKGEKVVDEFTKKAEDAKNELEDIQKVQGMGGGANGPRGSVMASVVGQVLGSLGQGIQDIGINQPMQIMGNIQGYAALENQKYDMWRAAVGGDMTARMNLGGMDFASEFGGKLRTRQQWATGFQAGAGTAGVVAGGLQTAEAGKNAAGSQIVGTITGNGATVENVAKGVGATVDAARVGATSGLDWYYNISRGQTDIAAQQRARALTATLNHIPGYQLQASHDYIVGSSYAASAIGGRAGNAFLDETNSDAFMGQMDTLGLGTERFGKLATQGANAMGSKFSSNTVLAAQKLENLGFGTTEDNMTRAAALQGAQNPAAALERSVELGVSRGLTSNKALSAIAENTGHLVDQSVKSGIGADISGFASKMLVGAIQESTPNKELALQAGASSLAELSAGLTTRGANFSDRMAIDRRIAGMGLNFQSAMSLRAIDPTVRASLAEDISSGKITPQQLQHELFMQGVDVKGNAMFNKDPKAFMNLERQNMFLETGQMGSGLGLGAYRGSSELLKWAQLSPENAQAIANGREDLMPDNIRDIVMRRIQAIKTNNKDANPFMMLAQQLGLGGAALGANGAELTSGVSTYGAVEERNRAAQQQTRAAREGHGKLGDGTGASAISGLVATGRNVQGAATEAQWATAAARSAKDFGASAIKLNHAGDRLIQAADALLKASGAKDDTKKVDEAFDKTKKEAEAVKARLDAKGTTKASHPRRGH